MMLTSISIQNFKLHKNTSLMLKPITIFIGSNNSGKSSVFQFIQILKQAKLNYLMDIVPDFGGDISSATGGIINSSQLKAKLIDLGTFEQVVHPKESYLSLSLIGSKTVDNKDYSYQVVWKIRQNRLIAHSGKFSCRDDDFSVDWDWDKDRDFEKSNSSELGKSFEFDGIKINYKPSENIGRILEFNGASKEKGVSQRVYESKMQEVNNKIDVLNGILLNIHYIYGLRGIEESHHPLADNLENGFENLHLYDRATRMTSAYPYDRALEERVSDWLRQYLKISIVSEIKPGKRVNIKVKKDGQTTYLVNEGLGIHQILFLLAPVALGDRGDTFMIEEPEAHLHPKAQTDLMKLLLQIVQKEAKQFLMATHSEHILYAFLNAVAKDELKAQDLAIYYFENVDGVAMVRLLEIDQKGRVKGGLPGFFEQGLQELVDALEAKSGPSTD